MLNFHYLFIRLACPIGKTGCIVCGILHFGKLVTAVGIGQVIHQGTVVVAVQILDIPVFIIFGHLFCICTCTMRGIQHTVHTIVSERIAVVAAICNLIHGRDVIIESSCTVA